MNDAFVVEMGKTVADLTEKLEDLDNAETLNVACEIAHLQVFHDQKVTALVLADLEKTDHVWVIERRQTLRLALETMFFRFSEQDFNRDLLIAFLIPGVKNNARPSTSQLSQDLEPIRQQILDEAHQYWFRSLTAAPSAIRATCKKASQARLFRFATPSVMTASRSILLDSDEDGLESVAALLRESPAEVLTVGLFNQLKLSGGVTAPGLFESPTTVFEVVVV